MSGHGGIQPAAEASSSASSAVPAASSATANPVVSKKEKPVKNARDPLELDSSQIKKLKLAEAVAAQAAEAAGFSVRFRIYETEDNGDRALWRVGRPYVSFAFVGVSTQATEDYDARRLFLLAGELCRGDIDRRV
ncbi:unnamed protein product [Amoebophrya sp. A25]|nr:unnamed protein product [Amoebophrya sp. A25]|eukprot:GSA25T00019200001.1